jgi:hypothetical protein
MRFIYIYSLLSIIDAPDRRRLNQPYVRRAMPVLLGYQLPVVIVKDDKSCHEEPIAA